MFLGRLSGARPRRNPEDGTILGREPGLHPYPRWPEKSDRGYDDRADGRGCGVCVRCQLLPILPGCEVAHTRCENRLFQHHDIYSLAQRAPTPASDAGASELCARNGYCPARILAVLPLCLPLALHTQDVLTARDLYRALELGALLHTPVVLGAQTAGRALVRLLSRGG